MALPYSNVLVRYRGFKRFRGVSEAFRSRGRRVVVVVLVEVAGTLLAGVLLPRGEVVSVGIIHLLAVFLEENEPALLTVTALWRGCGARVGALLLGRVEFATASQSGRRGGA